MGGMSGSGSADAAIDSKIIVPQMVKWGYDKPFAAAITSTSGILAAILPPSIVFILYGLQTGVSVGRLFVAGILPALVMAIALSVAVWFVARKRGYQPTSSREGGFRRIFRSFVHAFWSLMLPVILLVGLRMGVFTPTELGAICAVYALILGFAYRTISWREMMGMLREAATVTASIMIILASATAFGYFVTIERLPQQLVALLSGISQDPTILLLLLVGLLLLIGIIMESASLIIILAPLLAPVALVIGADPVHFGVIVVVALAIGGTTPPVGSVLYTVMTITGVKMGVLTKALLPFLLALLVAVIVIALIPWLSLFLPSVFYG
jgi:tripartite ATP-independent transporter DctM subunit